MLEITMEGIEADLQTAEAGGVSRGQIALVRAQIRAHLLTAQPAPTGRPAFLALPREGQTPDIQIAEGPFGDSYAVPAGAAWIDRVEAAARMLGIPPDSLEVALIPTDPEPVTIEAPTDPGPELDIEEDGVDADFFAEARKARRKS